MKLAKPSARKHARNAQRVAHNHIQAQLDKELKTMTRRLKIEEDIGVI